MANKRNTIVVALDGKDAVGKTKLLEALKLISRERCLGWQFLPEFSDSPIGDLIRKILVERRFFTLSSDQRLSVVTSETLLLAADLTFQLEVAHKTGGLWIIDRGITSLVGYQAVRLKRAGAFASSLEAVSFITSLIPAPLRNMHTLLLTVSESEMCRRIEARGELRPEKSELEFLASVEKIMMVAGEQHSLSIRIMDTDTTEKALVREAVERIVSLTD